MATIEMRDMEGVSYKGEGLANAVFSFPNRGHHLAGRVLRVAKRNKEGASTNYGTKERTLLDDKQEKHYDWLISVLVGPEYHKQSVEVHVSKEVLEHLQRVMEESSEKRAKKHLKATEIDFDSPTALLMIDFSLFLLTLPDASSASSRGFESSLCAEIKPKCGFLPTSRFVTHEAKRTYSRHWMYQSSKLARGEISQITHYSPLDLFSGDPARIRSTLGHLLRVPQNNIKLFWNGNVCFSGEAEHRGPPSASPSSSFTPLSHADGSLELSLLNWFHLTPSSSSSVPPSSLVDFNDEGAAVVRQAGEDDLGEGERKLCSELATYLSGSEVLERLLKMQKLDQFDIEYIWPLYTKFERLDLLEQFIDFLAHFSVKFAEDHQVDIAVPLPIETADLLRPKLYEMLHVDEDTATRLLDLPDEDFKASQEDIQKANIVIFGFLLGCVAKDCSLMVAINTAALPLVGQVDHVIAHRVATIDFDLKSVFNVPTYFKQDLSIVTKFCSDLEEHKR